MAQGKKSFVAYADWYETFKALPDDKAGQLIKHIFSYVNDENPISEDILITAVFANIKQTLKRDLCKYEIIREKRSLAGKSSADKRQQVLTRVEHDEQVLTHSTVNVSVNDSVSDNVNVSENKLDAAASLASKETKFINEVMAFEQYPQEMLTKFCDYWTELNKSKTKMRYEGEKFFDIKRRLNTWASREKTDPSKTNSKDKWNIEWKE